MTARRSTRKSSEPKGKFEELVSPDGSQKEIPLNAARDTQLRFNGFLPADQQKLEAPGKGDSGSSTLAGAENTVGSN